MEHAFINQHRHLCPPFIKACSILPPQSQLPTSHLKWTCCCIGFYWCRCCRAITAAIVQSINIRGLPQRPHDVVRCQSHAHSIYRAHWIRQFIVFVADCGAAPGSWIQVLLSLLPHWGQKYCGQCVGTDSNIQQDFLFQLALSLYEGISESKDTSYARGTEKFWQASWQHWC